MSRNVSNKNLFSICRFLDAWKPLTELEKRDKEILTLAYEFDMSCSEIANMNKFYGMSNRCNTNKPMSEYSIARLIASYKLVWEKKKDNTKANNYERRKQIIIDRYNGKYDSVPKICAICGSKKQLEMHHKIPISHGGSDEVSNMIYLCKKCHKNLHIPNIKAEGAN